MEATIKIFSMRASRWNNYLLPRLLVVPLFVIVCYLFSWELLRMIEMKTVLYASSWIGLNAEASSAYAFAWKEQSYQFYISCTMIDVFFASIPLLWKQGSSLLRNGMILATFFAGIYLLNTARILAGFLFFDWGMPWYFAHKVIGGVAYFVVLVWLIRQGGFLEPASSHKQVS